MMIFSLLFIILQIVCLCEEKVLADVGVEVFNYRGIYTGSASMY